MPLAGSFRAAFWATLLLVLVTAWASLAVTGAAVAEVVTTPSAAARLDLGQSSLTAEGRDRGRPRPLVLSLSMDGLLPYRVFLLGEPPRLVVDIERLDLDGAEATQLSGAELVPAIRWGRIATGRTRIVLELPGPMTVTSAEQTGQGDGARLVIRLAPVSAEAFRPEAQGDALPALFGLPEPATLPEFQPRAPGPLRVMLDPGHGGIDPGAVVGGLKEADLMLTVAGEVAQALRKVGAEVRLTRNEDVFLPLEDRMTAARSASADLFLSLHADMLPEGEAAGAAVYVWNPEADDSATAQLAARHDRDDLLAGMDLSGTDSEVARTLMDIARIDTQPRSQNLSQFLISEFAIGRIAIRNRPVKGAAFSVLKAPDIPSVLIETGFLSDPGDRANLVDPEWRAGLAAAIARAVIAWAEDDAARQPLLRH